MKASIKTLQEANAMLKAENKSFSGALSDIKKYYLKVDKASAKLIFPDKYSKDWEIKACEYLSRNEQKPTKNNPNGLSKYDLYKASEKYKQELINQEFEAHPLCEVYEKESDVWEGEKLADKIMNEIYEGAVYKEFLKNKRYNFSPYSVGMLAHAMYNAEHNPKK